MSGRMDGFNTTYWIPKFSFDWQRWDMFAEFIDIDINKYLKLPPTTLKERRGGW